MTSLKNNRILITGASGFVGANAVNYFLNKNSIVTACVSPWVSSKILDIQLGSIKNKIALKRANLLSPQESLKITENQNVIFHFAAVDGNSEFKNNYSAEIFSKNVRMTLNMLEAAVQQHTKTFVLISSTDIYAHSHKRVITESSPIDINWGENIDGYKLAKWSMELAAREFHKQYLINTIIVRPSNLYGPRDIFWNKERMRVIPTMIQKVFSTNDPLVIWGKKSQSRSFLYIDDFLSLCEQLINKNIYNLPINVASRQEVNLGELAKKILYLSGKKREIIIQKKQFMNNVSRKFNLSRLSGIFPNFSEVTLEEGIKKTINFYISHYL